MPEPLSWEQLRALAKNDEENLLIEFKEDRFDSLKSCAKEITESVVAFLNAENGGYVVLGVKDKTLTPTGTDKDLINLGNSINDQVIPRKIIYPYETEAEGERIIAFPIPESNGGYVTSDGKHLATGVFFATTCPALR